MNRENTLHSRFGKNEWLFGYAWWMPAVLVAAVFSLASFWIDPYLAYVGTSWIIFGLLGLSLDLVWGRGGLLSLGQTAFYGVGGYIGSIAAINLGPLTGNTVIWALPFGAVTGLIMAAFVGWFIFYGRMGPFQSCILTYTFTLILWTGSISYSTKIGDAVVGGDNGMSNIPGFVLGFGAKATGLDPNMMFLFVVLVSAIVFLIIQGIVRLPFGLIIDCIRIDSVKTELLGYDIRKFQLIVFMFSGAVAGIAGAMFGAWANYLNPSIFSVYEALLVPIYVLVGGLGTLVGPFIGALTVGGLSFWLGGGAIGGQTTLVMGICLILLVLFLRKGIVGGLQMAYSHLFRRSTMQFDAKSTGSAVRIDFDLLDTQRTDSTAGSGLTLQTVDALKRFGGVTPVDHISQTFEPGRVRCIIGPNGAGKSSYLKTCTGAYKPDAGQVLLGDKDITKISSFQRVNLGLGIKMQKAQVFDELTVQQNLWIAAYSQERDKKKADFTSNNMMKMLDMSDLASRSASALSHGEQQWLDIGMVLCLSPDVILLDEPAAGMTKSERQQLSKLVRALAKTSVVVVVEHDMDFVRTLDAEVTVLHQGAVFAQAEIEELQKNDQVLEIYLGRRGNVRDF